MLVMEVHVGIPTTERVAESVGATLDFLLSHALQGGLGCCVEDLADRLGWSTAVMMDIIKLQPIVRCYLARFGLERLLSVVRRVELCVIATLLRHYAKYACDNEDELLDHILGRQECRGHPKPVYH